MQWAFIVLVLATVCCKIVPFSPRLPADGLDQAWHIAMNHAIAAHMALGRDVIFTFGPYAFLYTRTYHPLTDHLMIGSALYLAVSYVVALVPLLRRGGITRVACVWLAIVVPSLEDNLFYLYPLVVGLAMWSLSEAHAKDSRSAGRWGWLPFVLCFPFGMISLIKGSFMILCVATAGLSIGFFVMRRMFVSSAAILAALIVSILFFWVLSGQALGDLHAYFHSMSEIAGGYSDAMASAGPPSEALAYIAAAALVALLVAIGSWGGVYGRLFVLGLFGIYLFLAFKGGFVRHDGHCIIAANAVLLAAAVLSIERRSAVTLICFVAVAGAYAYIIHGYASLRLKSVAYEASTLYVNAWRGVSARLSPDDLLPSRYAQAMKAIDDAQKLPKLEGGTDLYSLGQSYLLASDSLWNPRPVIQSYSAYTPWLAQVDRNHLLGDSAPQNIWFKVEPIDGRLPSIEDGLSWPELLWRYQIVALHGDYLLLHRRTMAAAAPRTPSALSTPVEYNFGRVIPVPKTTGLVMAEIHIKPSLIGKLTNVFFKRHPLSIMVNLEDGDVRSYRLVAGMAEAGFIISPLVEDIRDFGALYGAPEQLARKRVVSIRIDHLGGKREWNSSFTVSFRQLQLPPPQDVKRLLDMQLPVIVDKAVTEADGCEGSIDLVNGVAPGAQPMRTGVWVSALGWMAKSVSQSIMPDSMLLVFTDENGQRTFFPAKRKARPDVAAYFKKPGLMMAGYTTAADVSTLKGRYTMGLAYADGDSIKVCPLPKASVVLGE